MEMRCLTLDKTQQTENTLAKSVNHAREDDHDKAVDFIQVSEAGVTVEQHVRKIEVDKKEINLMY
jgi:hypothetical protein